MRVLITGAAGMLGTDLHHALRADHELILTDITGDVQRLDVTDTTAVIAVVEAASPDVVVHAAAYTDVDGCEMDPDKAFRVNTFGTWNVAAACANSGAAIVYLSTDFVFDGTKAQPYNEFDIPNPISHYGMSKLGGEQLVAALCPKHYIVRTAWLYGEHGRSFPRRILNEARANKELRVVSDQIGSPTFTVDLAAKVAQIIASPLYGIYHVTNKGSCSWYEFAKRTLTAAGKGDVSVKPITSAEWPTPTRRPANSVLKHYALEFQGMDDMRPWEEALADFISRIRDGL